jgi:hypothetical protein
MANVVIVTSGTNIDVAFNDYAGGSIPSNARYTQSDIIKIEEFSDHVAVTMRDEAVWYCVYTSTNGYLIIDTIDTVAPLSNADLYSKLKALM